jgi:LysR family transcriptional regulator, transcriptional activator of the cysJI operon
MIMREERARTTQVMAEGPTQHNITIDMLNSIIEIGNAEAIEVAVEERIGIAFVSELAAARGLALGRVKKVKVEGLDLRRTVYLVRNGHHPLTRAQI